MPWSMSTAKVVDSRTSASTRNMDAESCAKSEGCVKLKGNGIAFPPNARTETFRELEPPPPPPPPRTQSSGVLPSPLMLVRVGWAAVGGSALSY